MATENTKIYKALADIPTRMSSNPQRNFRVWLQLC